MAVFWWHGRLLWAPVFHHFLYPIHLTLLKESVCMFFTPVVSSREGRDERHRETGPVLLALVLSQYFFAVGPSSDDSGVSGFFFYLGMGVEVHIIARMPFCMSCRCLPTFPSCNLRTALLLGLMPSSGILSLSGCGCETWANKHWTGQDGLTCPVSLSGFQRS